MNRYAAAILIFAPWACAIESGTGPKPQPPHSEPLGCEAAAIPSTRNLQWDCGPERTSVQAPRPGASPHIFRIHGQTVCLTSGDYRGTSFEVSGSNLRLRTAPGFTFRHNLRLTGHHIELVGDFSGAITSTGQHNQLNGKCLDGENVN